MICSKESWSSLFVSQKEESDHVITETGEDSLSTRLLHIIHSHPVQLTLMVLLLIDVVAVVVELVLDGHFPLCSIVLKRVVCEDSNDGINPNCNIVCAELPETVETAHKALYAISVIILIIFLLELLILLSILRCGFFGHFMYMLDFVIVTTALLLEIVLHNKEDATALSLIVFARIWRFFRIGHGIFADTYEYSQHYNEELKNRITELEKLLSTRNNVVGSYETTPLLVTR